MKPLVYTLITYKVLLPELAEKLKRNWPKSPIYELLKFVQRDRNYDYEIRIGQWKGDHPSYFRSVHPLRVSNQRHILVDCDKIDKDPNLNDLSIMSACGTGFGVAYNGKIGIVSHGAPYGGYFLPQDDKNGKPIEVQRIYTGDHPEKGF